MDVPQVEAVVAGNLGHLGRQRQRIRRVFEQWIGSGFDSMVHKVGLVPVEPERQSIRYEMNVVPLQGQLLSQLGSHDSRAARDRITRYTYDHLITKFRKMNQLMRFLLTLYFLIQEFYNAPAILGEEISHIKGAFLEIAVGI